MHDRIKMPIKLQIYTCKNLEHIKNFSEDLLNKIRCAEEGESKQHTNPSTKFRNKVPQSVAVHRLSDLHIWRLLSQKMAFAE